MKEIKLRAFTKNDWYGFAGAEKFNNGANPLISIGDIPAKKGLGSNVVILAVDKNGVSINTPDLHVWILNRKFSSPDQARKWINQCLKVPISKLQLESLGFIEL